MIFIGILSVGDSNYYQYGGHETESDASVCLNVSVIIAESDVEVRHHSEIKVTTNCA